MKSLYKGENAPCKACEKRFVGCHGQCTEYQEYADRRKADRDDRQKKRELSEAQYAALLEKRRRHRK